MAVLATVPATGAPRSSDAVSDAAQDAELASLIRALVARRPEIASPVPSPPPSVAVLVAPAPLDSTAAVRSADAEARAETAARLRAIAAGRMRPGDHWPRHADAAALARLRRPTLRRRLAKAVPRRALRFAAAVAALPACASVADAVGPLPL